MKSFAFPVSVPVLVLVLGGSGFGFGLGLGCGGGGDTTPGDPDAGHLDPDAADPPPIDDTGTPFNYVASLPHGESQRAALCALERDDRFRRWYCSGSSAPTIDGLAAVLAGVKLGEDGFPQSGDAFAAVAHSTALGPVGASVLNPRVVFLSTFDETEFAATIFTRGEFVVELAMKDLVHNQINFYLVMYHLACSPDCTTADRHLQAADSGWKDVSVYAERDLQNTPLDCLRCHVPTGGTGKRILRMHEFNLPWTHWMFPPFGSATLATQFAEAHPATETYATIPVARLVEDTAPRDLQTFIGIHSDPAQPNEYKGMEINGDDPMVTAPSAAWTAMYEQAKQGKTIDAPPHFAISPFAKDRVAAASTAYRAVASGQAPPSSLPNVTRGLFDDAALRYIGYKPAAGLDARGMVNHVCAPCHDGRFPGMSRDNFRVSDFPDGLSAELRATVAARVGLAKDDPRLMPPVIAAELEAGEIQQIQAAVGGGH